MQLRAIVSEGKIQSKPISIYPHIFGPDFMRKEIRTFGVHSHFFLADKCEWGDGHLVVNSTTPFRKASIALGSLVFPLVVTGRLTRHVTIPAILVQALLSQRGLYVWKVTLICGAEAITSYEIGRDKPKPSVSPMIRVDGTAIYRLGSLDNKAACWEAWR